MSNPRLTPAHRTGRISTCVYCTGQILKGETLIEHEGEGGTVVEAHKHCFDNRTTKILLQLDFRNVKTRRRRLYLAWRWIRIPWDIATKGIAEVPDR